MTESNWFQDFMRETHRKTHPWKFVESGALQEPIPFDSPIPLFPPQVLDIESEVEPGWLVANTVNARLAEVADEDIGYLHRLSRCPEPWRVVSSTFEVDAQVQNGGVAQLLDNSPYIIDMARDGFVVLGLPGVSVILGEAQTVSDRLDEPVRVPVFSRLKRRMLGMADSGADPEAAFDAEFDRLTDQYAHEVESIQEMWRSYIRTNLDAFTTPQRFIR
jgi:hypothetical protein